MAEETIQQEEVKDVVAPAVEAPAETRKPEVRRDIFAELGLADDDDKIKILRPKAARTLPPVSFTSPPPSTTPS